MAAAEATGEIASGNESKGIQGREVCEEDHHSGLDLFWDTVALPDWEDVFYCGVGFGCFFFNFWRYKRKKSLSKLIKISPTGS